MHFFIEIAVRRGNHPHIDMDRFGTADATDFTFLQHPQKLRLHLGVYVANLVEKQRSALRFFKIAALGMLRPVNAPLT